MAQPLIESVIKLSHELLESLQAEELDMDFISEKEKLRSARIRQLFEQIPQQELQNERAKLDEIQQLDQQLSALLLAKKEQTKQQLLQLRRGQAKTDAYKVNRF